MNEMGNNLLKQAEGYIQQGQNAQAIPLLAQHLQHEPNSAQGWWMLSFVISDIKKQIECVERVLKLRPNYVQARVRLDALRKAMNPQPIVPPFATPVPISNPPVESQHESKMQGTPGKRPVSKALKKKKDQTFFQMTVLGIFGVVALSVAVGVVFLGMQALKGVNQTPLQSTPNNITEVSMPATWTPTVTSTARPTSTPYPSFTPLVLPTAVVLPTQEAFQVGPARGYYAPDFTLTDVNTEQSVRLADYRGKAVIVFFWATWCPYCNAEMPSVQKLHEAYSDKGLVILGVDVGENAGTARRYGKAKEITFSILNDPKQRVASDYQVNAFPTHYFIDPSGVITSITVGGLDYWTLVNKVQAMLGTS